MKNSKRLSEVMAKIQKVGTKVQLDNVLESKYMNNGEHYSRIDSMNTGLFPSLDEQTRINPKQDADIKTGKGEIGGYRYNSIFSTFTEKSIAYNNLLDEIKLNEKDFNIMKEVSEFIKFCIDNGHTTLEEIDAMCSMQIGVNQVQEYMDNEKENGNLALPLNAYALHSVYGTYLGKISNAITKQLKPAIKYLENKMPNVDLTDKSDRWIYDKAHFAMSDEWNNEMAILFDNKNILTEQLAQKANTLTIGDSPFRYALTMAGLYYTIFNRETKKYHLHMAKVLNGTITDLDDVDYDFKGIASIFSLFTIGTADFLFQHKQLSENKEVKEKKMKSFNANLVLLRFDKSDFQKATNIYNQYFGFWDQELTFVTEGNDVKFMDIFTLDHASDSTSIIKQSQKQFIAEKDLFNVHDEERKSNILDTYAKTAFSRHGLFNMKHDYYKGKVVHSTIHNSMIKLWMVDVTAGFTETEVNNVENQLTFGLDVDKDFELISKEIDKEESRKAINNLDYYDASEDYAFDNTQVIDVQEYPTDDLSVIGNTPMLSEIDFMNSFDEEPVVEVVPADNIELPDEAYEQFVDALETQYADSEYLGY